MAAAASRVWRRLAGSPSGKGLGRPAVVALLAGVFEPSSRQSEALANMEDYCGIRSHRTAFADAEAFQAYWDLVAARCDRQRRQRQRQAVETPAQRRAREQRQARARRDHYRDHATLLAYARRYQQRYQPARARLRQQLLDKCDDAALCDSVIAALADRLDDGALARQHADRLVAQGRNRSHIRQYLRRKRFAPELVDAILTALAETTGSVYDTDRDGLQRRVARLLRQGRSQQEIRRRLIERPADRDPVETALATALAVHGEPDEQGDEANLRRQLERFQRQGLDERRLIERLLRRGFRYPDIRRLLADRG